MGNVQDRSWTFRYLPEDICVVKFLVHGVKPFVMVASSFRCEQRRGGALA